MVRYKPKPKDDEPIRQQLRQMADLHSAWGFWMMYYRLRALNFTDNNKRVYRIYTEMKLNLRRKYKRRLPLRIKSPLVQPLHHNLTWSMDFVHDGLIQGKSFRAFNVIDDFNREVLTIAIDTSLTSQRVVRELNKLVFLPIRNFYKRIQIFEYYQYVSSSELLIFKKSLKFPTAPTHRRRLSIRHQSDLPLFVGPFSGGFVNNF